MEGRKERGKDRRKENRVREETLSSTMYDANRNDIWVEKTIQQSKRSRPWFRMEYSPGLISVHSRVISSQLKLTHLIIHSISVFLLG